MDRSSRTFRFFLVVAGGFVLWYAGHFLLNALWAFTGPESEVAYSRALNLLLIPVAFATSWLVLSRLPREREGERPGERGPAARDGASHPAGAPPRRGTQTGPEPDASDRAGDRERVR